MKPIRRDETGIAVPVAIIVIVVVLALAFVGLYAAGFLSPASGSPCPASVCPIGGDKPIWIRVDVMGTVVPGIGSPPGIKAGSLQIVAAIATTPASLLRPPQIILDESWTLDTSLSVSYPNGETHSYHVGVIQGTNQMDFDSFYFLQGPHGQYTITATESLAQVGCWLGCAPPLTYTIVGHFNL